MGKRKSPNSFFVSPFPLLSFPAEAWAAVCTPVIIHDPGFHLQGHCSPRLMNPSAGLLQKTQKPNKPASHGSGNGGAEKQHSCDHVHPSITPSVWGMRDLCDPKARSGISPYGISVQIRAGNEALASLGKLGMGNGARQDPEPMQGDGSTAMASAGPREPCGHRLHEQPPRRITHTLQIGALSQLPVKGYK